MNLRVRHDNLLALGPVWCTWYDRDRIWYEIW